jgi:flavin-binding protein dodecin
MPEGVVRPTRVEGPQAPTGVGWDEVPCSVPIVGSMLVLHAARDVIGRRRLCVKGRRGETRAMKENEMSDVARVTEISARSTVSFEDAIKVGVERATQSLRGVTSAWVKEQQIKVEDGQVAEYQVNLLVTFVLE